MDPFIMRRADAEYATASAFIQALETGIPQASCTCIIGPT